MLTLCMLRLRVLVTLLLLPACTTTASAPRSTLAVTPAPIRLAITVDDLPGAGDSLPDWPKARVLDTLIATLRKHAVPSPVGFFNGGNMDDAPATPQALQRWVEAGFRLGNHTYSHSSADQVGASAFIADIARDDATLDALLQGRPGKAAYFRFPYLDRGQGEDRTRIRAYLKERGLRVSDVSVDYEDWAFTDAYARCSESGNQKAVSDLTSDYRESALAELFWADETAQRVLGRSLPQVLLIHANLITAHELDNVLTAYRAAGVQFISLEQAMADPVYTELETPQHTDVTLIEALIMARKAEVRSFMPPASAVLDAVCH